MIEKKLSEILSNFIFSCFYPSQPGAYNVMFSLLTVPLPPTVASCLQFAVQVTFPKMPLTTYCLPSLKTYTHTEDGDTQAALNHLQTEHIFSPAGVGV